MYIILRCVTPLKANSWCRHYSLSAQISEPMLTLYLFNFLKLLLCQTSITLPILCIRLKILYNKKTYIIPVDIMRVSKKKKKLSSPSRVRLLNIHGVNGAWLRDSTGYTYVYKSVRRGKKSQSRDIFRPSCVRSGIIVLCGILHELLLQVKTRTRIKVYVYSS